MPTLWGRHVRAFGPLQAELIGIFLVHLALAALPGAAAALAAARLGVRSVPALLALALAATGALAMLAFWAFWADPLVGESFSYLVLLGSIAASGWALWGRRIKSALLVQLAVPLGLWALGSGFLVFLGFDHGGISTPIELSASRFTHPLPTDNFIPAFYTEWFYVNGHSPAPPIFTPEWHFSDRPPLQVGYMLLHREFFWDGRFLTYQVTGVLLQQLWIVGLWAVLLAAGLGRRTRALAIAAVLVSDVAIVNGFFVWPKMLPAAMLLGAAALAMTAEWSWARRSLPAAALVAALLALAMLGHGSSIFGVIPIAAVALWRGRPSWRWVGVAVAVGLVLFLPWMGYQRYADPPGDRLLKWQLGGVTAIDPRGAAETILDSYDEAGIGGSIHNKGQNFVTMLGGGPAAQQLDRAADALGDGDLSQAARELRGIFFFNLFPAFGLLLLAPVLMALRRGRRDRRPREWSFALNCFWVVLVGAISWGLILFGNVDARATIHVGSFVVPLLGFAGAVAGIRAVAPRFALYYIPIASALSLALYVPALDPLPGTSFAPLLALLSALSLAGFVAVAWLAPDPPAAATDVAPRAPASPLAAAP